MNKTINFPTWLIANICFISPIYLISLSFFIVIGCTREMRNDIQTLSINPVEAIEEINLSEIADSLFVIQLVPPQNVPFAQVRQIIIRERFIYTVDIRTDAILLFDPNGNFVSQLQSPGRGPGEYLKLGPVFVADDESVIEILTHSGEGFGILKYSCPDFQYLSFEPYPIMYIDSGVKSNENYYLGNHQSVNIMNGTTTNSSLFTICQQGQVSPHLDYERTIDDYFMGIHGDNFVVDENKEVYFSQMYDNVIYKIFNCKPEPWYEINFGFHQSDNSIRHKPGREQLQYLQQAEQVALFPFLKVHKNNLLVLSYLYKQSISSGPWLFSPENNRHYILIPSKEKAFHAHRIRNDLTSFPEFVFFGPEYRGVKYNILHDNYLIDILFPGNSIRNSIIAEDLYDSNSILLAFIKTKNFD